jgi:hypothetical protein
MNSQFLKYRITLHLYYVHSDKSFEDERGNDNFIDEPKLSLEELDVFMKDFAPHSIIPRYMQYAQNIADIITKPNTIRMVENYPFDMDYDDNGILKFSVMIERERTTDNLKRAILEELFEDGMYEGPIGNECNVPTREKYPVKHWNPEAVIQFKYSLEYFELGKIDCRSSHCIDIRRMS